TTLLDYEKALAVELLSSPQFQDYNVGVVVFGTRAYNVIDPVPLARSQNVLADRIATLAPTGTEDSYLDSGLELAQDMILAGGGEGEIIVLSDGNLHNYQEVVARSKKLIQEVNITTRLIQVQAIPGRMGSFPEIASSTNSEFASFVYPDSLTTISAPLSDEPKPEEVNITSYSLAVVNRNHYITTDLDLNASISGFNDVTPKSGSIKLVALADGKPVLTAWRYGLGRVAALTTDDGNAWAGQLYSSPNSQLISSAVNWAVGDPRPEMDRVEGEDGWQNTPLQITINSRYRPSLPEASVEKVGENRYIATFTPSRRGIYYIGEYGVAVNYPLEYRYIGFNPDLPGLIMANGGKVFTEGEAERSLIAEASRLSQRMVEERVSSRDSLLLIALLIFLLEIVSRKINEIRRQGQRGA
ncbi:VWA domain-containing protein, partial [Methanothrix sp.]